MEKTLTILRICLLSILIIILSWILYLFINKDFNINLKTQASLIYDNNIKEEFDKIDIYTESMDFKFVKSNDDTTNIKIYDSKDNIVNVKVENNILKIESNKNNRCFLCTVDDRETIITLPEKEYELVVNTKSGDIKSADINFNKADIITKSGDVGINKIKEANINVTSGDIIITEVDNLTIESTSGDVKINKINNQLDIKTTSGDISINDLSLTKDSKIKVTSGDIKIYSKSSDIYYNAKATSGDILITNNNRHANTELTISTTSGDITVNN